MQIDSGDLLSHFSRLRSLTGPVVDSNNVVIYTTGNKMMTVVSSPTARVITSMSIPTEEGKEQETFEPVSTGFQKFMNIVSAVRGSSVNFSVGKSSISISGTGTGKFRLPATQLDMKQMAPMLKDIDGTNKFLYLKPELLRVLTEIISSLSIGDVKGSGFRIIIHTEKGQANIAMGYGSVMSTFDIKDEKIDSEVEIETDSGAVAQAIRAMGLATSSNMMELGLGDKIIRLRNDDCKSILTFTPKEGGTGMAQIKKMQALMKTTLSTITVPVERLSTALANAVMVSGKALTLPLTFTKEGVTVKVNGAGGSYETSIGGGKYELKGKETDVQCVANPFSRMLKSIAMATGEDTATIRVYAINEKSFYVTLDGGIKGENARLSYAFKMVKND